MVRDVYDHDADLRIQSMRRDREIWQGGLLGRKFRIWETNYGRDTGWLIEQRGEVIAVLTDPRFEDLFWESYRIEVVATDVGLRRRMETSEFWASAESEGLVWRSQEFGELVRSAFPALSPFPQPGRLMMRRLYLAIGEPWPWDRLTLWWRRRYSRRKAAPDATTDGER